MLSNQFSEVQAIIKHFAMVYIVSPKRVCIAGSWVLNPFRASDIDVWITDPDIECLEYGPLANVKHESNWHGQSVHIMFTPFTVEELVEEFDWSCCCHAMNSDGIYIRGPRATDMNEPIRQVGSLGPNSQKRRVKFEERYKEELNAASN